MFTLVKKVICLCVYIKMWCLCTLVDSMRDTYIFLYIFVGVIMACVHIISKALYIPHLVLSLFVLLFFECHPLLNHGIYLANNKLVGGNS